jgi:hypothetical protein
MIPDGNGHFGHSTHSIFLYFFAIFLGSTIGGLCGALPCLVSSTAILF